MNCGKKIPGTLILVIYLPPAMLFFSFFKKIPDMLIFVIYLPPAMLFLISQKHVEDMLSLMPFTPRYAIFYAIYPKLCYRLCHIPRSSAIFFLNVMLQYITLTPSYANSSYAMFSGQSQGRISGYCCTYSVDSIKHTVLLRILLQIFLLVSIKSTVHWKFSRQANFAYCLY